MNSEINEIPAAISPPVIIGATGGSGTRVITRIARQAGYYMGKNLNVSEDALEFSRLYNFWLNRLIRESLSPPATDFPKKFERDFNDAVRRHLAAADPAIREPSQRWSWKAPRSIYLLPFFHARFPGMKFIHVLRDGRDMAISGNQNQLRKHGHRLLNWRERWLLARPVRSILLWDRVNFQAAAYAETHFPENYLVVRFEDLCLEPVETTSRILKFLETPGDAEKIARAEISPPSSLGRWRSQPRALIAKMERAAGNSLRKFGYFGTDDSPERKSG
ncbi:MAG TPA: sulfotransferase [Verrucomicrobiae bacterium]|nr:sulfotransferase [Verrucomicrobiae bacterium]